MNGLNLEPCERGNLINLFFMDSSSEEEPEISGGGKVSIPPRISSMVQYERTLLPDLLRVYYTWLFPYDKYFDWLHYGEYARYRPGDGVGV